MLNTHSGRVVFLVGLMLKRDLESTKKSCLHSICAASFTLMTKGANVLASPSSVHEEQRSKATTCLLKICTTLQFLDRHGIAIRGHNEADGNSEQILKMRSDDIPDLETWLHRKTS